MVGVRVPGEVGVKVQVVDHPLVAHKLTALRDVRTASPTFRSLCEELVTLLAYEATRDVHVEACEISTPIGVAPGVRLAAPKPLVVPILRAGLGMLDGMLRLLPTADVGFLGLVRDEITLTAGIYADRVPVRLDGRHCFVLDPMLATGGTMATAAALLLGRGAKAVHAVSLLASPDGLANIETQLGPVADSLTVILAGLDPFLDEHGFIVPGLGDAGDRLFGSA
jgi:uracil phosphoribosyltransferase